MSKKKSDLTRWSIYYAIFGFLACVGLSMQESRDIWDGVMVGGFICLFLTFVFHMIRQSER